MLSLKQSLAIYLSLNRALHVNARLSADENDECWGNSCMNTESRAQTSARADKTEPSKASRSAGAAGTFAHILASRKLHFAMLVVGTLYLLTDAFHGNIWFDESYSVGVANHSFADIWTYSSGDVHPVLYYWALHVLNLIFGQNIEVYRIFTVFGATALATLGLTHIRRDHGWKVGLIFSFFALFTPYVAVMAVEIRMYSWATFAVMLCFIYAIRIIGVLKENPHESISKLAQGKKCWGGAPRAWWIACFAASLASAYLQYFGAMSAFMINLVLLAFCIRRARKHKGETINGTKASAALKVLIIGCIVQVALYMPWIYSAVLSQLGVVGKTYWAKISFPTTFIELATYGFLTSFVSFGARGSYGAGVQTWLTIMGFAAVFVLSFLVVWAVRWGVWRAALNKQEHQRQVEGHPDGEKAFRKLRRQRFACWLATDEIAPIVCALAVYFGVVAISLAASLAMNSLIVYYRYLFVCIGPILFAGSAILARVKTKPLLVSVYALVIASSITNQALLISDDYDERNQVPITRFREIVDQVSDQIGGQSPLIVSTDIGYMGVTSVMCPDIPQTYMDWQKGNWDRAYMAYSPTLTSKMSWEIIFDNFHGTFICLGQSQDGSLPRDIYDLSQKDGFTLQSYETYYRPYERTHLTIAVMTKS